MGKLIFSFSQNQKKYVVRKHQFSEKSNWDKVNKIKVFLMFCESKNVTEISNIKQKHYDQFIQNLSEKKLSVETIRKYSITIKQFAVRAHLDLRIAPARAKRNKEIKKMKNIKNILKKYDIDPEIITKILPDLHLIM